MTNDDHSYCFLGRSIMERLAFQGERSMSMLVDQGRQVSKDVREESKIEGKQSDTAIVCE